MSLEVQLQSSDKIWLILKEWSGNTCPEKNHSNLILKKKIQPTTVLNGIFTEWFDVNASKQHWSNFSECINFFKTHYFIMSVTAQKAATCIHRLMETTWFFIYLDLHNQKLCTRHSQRALSVLSRQSFRLCLSGDGLFVLATENMFAVKDKKRRQHLSSDLTLQETNREKSFSPRGNQGTGVQTNIPPLRHPSPDTSI